MTWLCVLFGFVGAVVGVVVMSLVSVNRTLEMEREIRRLREQRDACEDAFENLTGRHPRGVSEKEGR